MPAMRMLNTGSSPWASRVRMVIYAKGPRVRDAITFVAPGGPIHRPVHRAQFALGRSPTLWIGDTVLQESFAIMNYLDEAHPNPPLKPANIIDRARMWMLCFIVEGSIMDPVKVLFRKRDPRLVNPDLIASSIAAIEDGFDRLEYYLSDAPYAMGDALTLADCSIVSVLWQVFEFLPPHCDRSPFLNRPRCATYWESIKRDPAIAEVLSEMDAHIKAVASAKLAEREKAESAART